MEDSDEYKAVEGELISSNSHLMQIDGEIQDLKLKIE